MARDCIADRMSCQNRERQPAAARDSANNKQCQRAGMTSQRFISAAAALVGLLHFPALGSSRGKERSYPTVCAGSGVRPPSQPQFLFSDPVSRTLSKRMTQTDSLRWRGVRPPSQPQFLFSDPVGRTLSKRMTQTDSLRWQRGQAPFPTTILIQRPR